VIEYNINGHWKDKVRELKRAKKPDKLIAFLLELPVTLIKKVKL